MHWVHDHARGGFRETRLVATSPAAELDADWCAGKTPFRAEAVDEVALVGLGDRAGVVGDDGECRWFRAYLRGVQQLDFRAGDLRRLMERRRGEAFELSAKDCLTAQPVTIGPEEFASAALHLMEERKITSVIVVDAERRALGVLHVHDLWTLELF